ncbi:unnamed protein product [Penicillium salamii]|uniref:Two-component system protein A n=1 Tax=Penicillium salamii TaxID=1612424 RepID=A0A9W4NKF1_9EURO|nr:unnamed protein product [Penicillium salamii]CAG8172331.1 unnamed protein product [Penicillium salamii]CAG8242655.1 unnamed protein product [Penicillium salamii]CAG8302365.1 unnamed protein product [Penicillium salamii]CAG8369968.1 unnamed protein product [Penicillium salamii]
MPVDQLLHLRIAERPVNKIAVITPPDEADLNLENKGKGAAPDLSLCRIYRLTPKPTIVLDASLRIIEVSNSHVEIFQRSRDHLLNSNVYDLPASVLAVPSIPSLSGALAAAISTRQVQATSPVYVNECDAFYALNVTPIFEDDALLCVLLEAERTTRKAPVNDHQNLNEAYRVLVDSVKDYAIFMLDTHGHIATWNSGAAILKGYTASEIIGQHFSVFYSREDREQKKPARELELCIQEGRVEDDGWRYRKDGSRFWANVMITAIFQNGTLAGFVKVTRDLTERRAAEARLISVFEESVRLKSAFLANMSHELRTPMNGMFLALTMLLKTELNAEQRDYACILEDSTSILLQVINDVLDYSKLSSETFPLTKEVLNIDSIITAVVRNCQTSLKPGVKLTPTMSKGFPQAVKGDPLRFRQVLQNLVSNAVKFTEKGHIRINAKFAVDEKEPDSYLITIEVVDTGIGIPEDAESVLFTPFTRFADTATKRYQGTGLGLSICKSLVELMDGAIGFHANPDRPGSVFWMTAKLPRVTSPVSTTRKSLPPITPSTIDQTGPLKIIAPHKYILLVEDNNVNRTIMVKLLSTLGFERVDAAWNGAEAVRMVKQKPLAYNVILMDINMPVMDGLTATEHIRQINLDVPILALTGNALKGDAETYLSKGMNDYIAKPLHRQQLVDLLWKWCGS